MGKRFKGMYYCGITITLLTMLSGMMVVASAAEDLQGAESQKETIGTESEADRFLNDLEDRYQLEEILDENGNVYHITYDEVRNRTKIAGENTTLEFVYEKTNYYCEYRVICEKTEKGSIDYIYEGALLSGFSYKGTTYQYDFDSQGNAVGIRQDGKLVAKYAYDGDTFVYEVGKDGSTRINKDPEFIGNVNPYRFGACTGYHYDYMYDKYFTGLLYYDLKTNKNLEKQDVIVPKKQAQASEPVSSQIVKNQTTTMANSLIANESFGAMISNPIGRESLLITNASRFCENTSRFCEEEYLNPLCNVAEKIGSFLAFTKDAREVTGLDEMALIPEFRSSFFYFI